MIIVLDVVLVVKVVIIIIITRSSSSSSNYYMTTLPTMVCVFFWRFLLQRNHYIKSVELVEASSILLPPTCLEASGW